MLRSGVKSLHGRIRLSRSRVSACTPWAGCVPVIGTELLLVTAEEVERIKRTVEGWDLDFEVILGGELLHAACAQCLQSAT